jgi:hypothetical protein
VNLAHVSGIPVEETLLQLAPAGAAIVTVVAIAGRTQLDRMRSRLQIASKRTELVVPRWPIGTRLSSQLRRTRCTPPSESDSTV